MKDVTLSSFASSLVCETPSNDEQKPVEAQTEAEVIHLAQTGDETAFEFLYKTNSQRIYALCLRLSCKPGIAEELMQEAFLQAFRKINSFRAESRFSTWLYRIAFNTVLMNRRKRSLQEVALGEAYEAEDGSCYKEQFGELDPVASATCDRVTLNRAVKELPRGYKKVLLLHDVLGHEHSEIAKLLGCSIGNSKSQLHKARMRMREILEVKRRRRKSDPSLRTPARVPKS